MIQATSPNRDEFIKYMQQFDPQGIFLNKFGRRLLGVSKDMDIDPAVKRCALQDYCICSKNSDCAPLQQCRPIEGYPACNDIGTIIMPSTFKSYNPTNLTSIYESIEKYYKNMDSEEQELMENK
jgi:hypothetical protein